MTSKSAQNCMCSKTDCSGNAANIEEQRIFGPKSWYKLLGTPGEAVAKSQKSGAKFS
jgi:hypothetical protein